MKTLLLILLLSIPTVCLGSTDSTKPITKKEVITKKSNDVIDVNFYIKSLKLKTKKTKLC